MYNCTTGATKDAFLPLRFKDKKVLKNMKDTYSQMNHDFQLTKKVGKGYFFVVSLPLEFRERRQENQVCSIDPGVRTFATVYNVEGRVEQWANQMCKKDSKLYNLLLQKDNIRSRIDKKKDRMVKILEETALPLEELGNLRKLNNQIKSLKKTFVKKQHRISGLVKELHCKLVKDLLDNNQVVLYPDFCVSQMVRKTKKKLKEEERGDKTGIKVKRKIGKATVRKLLAYKFFQFKQRLLFKKQEYQGSRVIICTEEYTSKTCGQCGVINETLGASETFSCKTCGFSIGRDFNGARNILNKWLTEHRISSI